MSKYEHVFSPFRIGNVVIRNRIECGPAVPILATPDGYVTRELIEWHKPLARGGAAIVTIGDTAIDFDYSHNHESQLNLGTDHVIPGLRRLVEAIHRYGAKASIELNHGGIHVSPRFLNGKDPIGPSSLPISMLGPTTGEETTIHVKIREMDQDLIDQVIENYANAVYRCLQAGFEIVSLHGAHGHLLAQFVSPYTNRRTDGYGGSPEKRARFPLEVLTAIRKKVGNKVALEYRISGEELIPEGMQVEDTIEFIKMIQDKIDLVHVSAGIIGDPRTDALLGGRSPYMPPLYNLERAAKIKKAVQVPVAVVGAIKDLETADKIIADGKADICVMVTSILADPEIINKTQRGEIEDVRPCTRCTHCNERSRHLFPVLCAINPVTGREAEFSYIPPAQKIKKVLIVGGGPAGMEAAQIASSRGHKVTLYEKEAKLGGMLNLASVASFKYEMKKYLDWLIRETKKHPVEIKLSTEVTADTIKAEKPDVVIVAAGATPLIPDIPGADKPNAVWAGEVEQGAVKTGNSVLIAGAGLTGLETALDLAQKGKRVTVIDMLGKSEIGRDIPFISRVTLMMLLDDHGVEIKPEVKLEEVTDGGAVVTDNQSQRYEIAVDTVVFAMGMQPRDETAKMLQGLVREVYVVGDCRQPRNLMAAIHEAFNVAVEI